MSVAQRTSLALGAVAALALLAACSMDLPTKPAASMQKTVQPASDYASTQTIACSDPVTTAPTGPATVSVAQTRYGRVLVVGSGTYAGCSLYLLTSDQLHSLSGAAFACSDNPNILGAPCDLDLWPALLTKGHPVAGPGVNPSLLGTVTRTDMGGLGSVQEVTYAGLPLYRFSLDETVGETDGANLFDPVTSPTGIWYQVSPTRGLPAPGRARLLLESVGDQTVLAVAMGNNLDPNATDLHESFPVYTLSTSRDPGHTHDSSTCTGLCAQNWPPVLTSTRPEAGPGVDQVALGITVRPDGSQQVTYQGRPLYLYAGDAYLGLLGQTPSLNGAGLAGPGGGVFNTIPASPQP